MKAISLFILTLMVPLVVFASIAVEIEPAASPAEPFGRFMLKVGALPIAIETAEANAESITLEKALLAADAASSGIIPAKLFLEQNYPNPFNPSTMIRYGLPAQTNVRLSIHSLLGNQVKVVFEATQDPGIYTYDFSAQDLPSGMYFYRLQTDVGTLTRRMTISK